MIKILTKFSNLLKGINGRLALLYFRMQGLQAPNFVWLRGVSIPRQHASVSLEAFVALDNGVILLCSGDPQYIQIRIGERTYINRNTFIDAIQSVSIGNDCAIGPNCYITDHDHGLDPEKPPLKQEMNSKPTKIEDRVWIGANVVILKGVTIGVDSVIGAGSVVVNSIPDRSIAVGNPCRVIKYK